MKMKKLLSLLLCAVLVIVAVPGIEKAYAATSIYWWTDGNVVIKPGLADGTIYSSPSSTYKPVNINDLSLDAKLTTALNNASCDGYYVTVRYTRSTSAYQIRPQISGGVGTQVLPMIYPSGTVQTYTFFVPKDQFRYGGCTVDLCAYGSNGLITGSLIVYITK